MKYQDLPAFSRRTGWKTRRSNLLQQRNSRLMDRVWEAEAAADNWRGMAMDLDANYNALLASAKGRI